MYWPWICGSSRPGNPRAQAWRGRTRTRARDTWRCYRPAWRRTSWSQGRCQPARRASPPWALLQHNIHVQHNIQYILITGTLPTCAPGIPAMGSPTNTIYMYITIYTCPTQYTCAINLHLRHRLPYNHNIHVPGFCFEGPNTQVNDFKTFLLPQC